jgi:transcriptional regulator with XRE-family HTH domain
MTTMGDKIKALRKDKKLSLDKLAAMTGLSKSYIWDLENKKLSNPTINKITRIASALDVTNEYLTNVGANLTDKDKKEVFFRKFEKLAKIDQKRLMALIDMWSDEKLKLLEEGL